MKKLEDAVRLLYSLKRDLMSARRLQADVLSTYRSACVQAEADIESWLEEYRDENFNDVEEA